MEIRFAEAKDVAGILALLRQVGQVHYETRPDIFRCGAQKYGPSQVLSMLQNPQNPIFVAVDGEKVAGYCFCMVKIYENDPVMTDRKELYIDDLCVDESIRNQGLGKKIFDEVCRYANMRKIHTITLNVWCGNDSAMAFYEKLGMTPQKIGMEMNLA